MAEVRILVVEYEGIISLQIQTMLRSMEYDVCGKASSGQDAIDKASETRPDLVLMDVRLKDSVDGIEAARQIVARFNTPVVFVSGCGDEETLQRAGQPPEPRPLRGFLTLGTILHRQPHSIEFFSW